MAVTTPFKNVLLIGATGSIGRHVLAALLAEPSLTVTILRRASSSSSGDGLPGDVRTVTVPDDYPTEAVTAAFRGQDVVVSCLTTLSVAAQFRLIDAAAAAGVRRYVPSEYGLNNARPDAQALSSVFRDKGAVQAYLRGKADKGEMEWMSVSCGMWIRWSMQNDFLGMRVRQRAFERWDGGAGRFSVTTEENTALAVVRSLVELPDETRNRNVLVSEFVTTQAELLAEIERQLGEKLAVTEVDSGKRIAALKEAEAAGDGMAKFGLIEAGFVTGRYGSDLAQEGELFTDKLRLKRHSLEEVVADALASL